ncbi:MAG: radical SAM protein [Proteobacteria bacterium]|nr:radical SAM protein [Pseudomonadota bacterium]
MYTTLPGYKQLYAAGILRERAELLWKMFSSCRLCPWQCGADRTSGQRGRCQAPGELKVAKALAHFGEEPVLSGTRGAGTIFFSHCHLQCCFCQNYQISQEGLGEVLTVEALAQKMLSLQKAGCHNISLVPPTHYLPHIVEALCLAAAEGLSLPLVYNSNGYESLETLKLLSGVVDIYLPDAKYANDALAKKYSQAKDYSQINLAALREMFAQVGPLVTDENGTARKGLIIRHLVLPANIAGTQEVLERIKSHLGSHIHMSLMCQYLPAYKAPLHQELSKRTSSEEYDRALVCLEALGFENGWLQEHEEINGEFLPDFEKGESWN